ncbi:alpha/beta hydrolase family protein [Actinoallomurus iriomotensis]|uniref:Alpha/beta hydrolase n=1 Tax=Actinoallomurus iriomotensis TaxID=478107 RepID=A0A9W6RNH9_9ACTN|nr:alpha/beta fold hydrolase [Actinoallomurus iriomotensis]GLY78719.1 alpha/beta hydrolase [Actinoallomurus iriomotensis]
MSAVAPTAGRLLASRLRVAPPRPVMVRLLGADAERVTLESTPETCHRGRFGLSWPGGDAIVGDVVAEDGRTVTRRLITSMARPPRDGVVRWNKFVHRGDPYTAHGLPFDEVVIDGPLGPLPAWYLPGRRSTWVLAVHGNRATREEALRVLPALSGAGFPVLVPAYRNDPEAPRSPDGMYHLGDTEWADLDAAVRYALRSGAGDVVLYGWSMGGGIVETFLDRSAHAGCVRAAVLDAPLLNAGAVTDAQLRRLHLPQWAGGAVKRLVTDHAGIDLTRLDHQNRPDRRPVPTLLFHGDADVHIPVACSDAFARRHGELVGYVRVPDCAHTLAWNADPRAYEKALIAFLVHGRTC